MSNIELVVARYTEDISWLKNTPKSLIIRVYDKHPTHPHTSSVSLPNVGREAHSYLTHIVEEYENLANFTVFCQGKPFDHAFDFHTSLRTFVAQPPPEDAFVWLGHLADTDDAAGERLFVPWSKNPAREGLELNTFHQEIFGVPGPVWYPFLGGGQFGVGRARVHQRPREFYENALRIATDFPNAAHCFERSWGLFFDEPQYLDAILVGEMSRFLKPVKALNQR